MTRYRVAIVAGKTTVGAAVAARYLDALDRDYNLHAMFTTEHTQADVVQQARGELGDGWAVQRGGEYLMAWKRMVIRGSRPTMRVRQLTDVKGFPDWRNVFVAIRGLRVKRSAGGLERPVTAIVGHMPAGVEFGTRWRPGGGQTALAVAASKLGFTRIGRVVRRRVRQFRGGMVWVFLDGNLDLFEPAWMAFTNEHLHAISVYANVMPDDGDHHGRLITGMWIAGRDVKVISTKVVRPRYMPAAYDHGTVIITLDVW